MQPKIMEPLTDPTAHGGDAADTFHLVIPSARLRFLGKPEDTAGNTDRIARAADTLMKRLGYTQYVSQGRLGASVARVYWENARIVYKGEVSLPAALRLPGRDLPCAAELGRENVHERHLLQRGRRGWALRRMGGARALLRRGPGRFQITPGRGDAGLLNVGCAKAGPATGFPRYTLASDFDGEAIDGKGYRDRFSGRYSHKILEGIGHNVP